MTDASQSATNVFTTFLGFLVLSNISVSKEANIISSRGYLIPTAVLNHHGIAIVTFSKRTRDCP